MSIKTLLPLLLVVAWFGSCFSFHPTAAPFLSKRSPVISTLSHASHALGQDPREQVLIGSFEAVPTTSDSVANPDTAQQEDHNSGDTNLAVLGGLLAFVACAIFGLSSTITHIESTDNGDAATLIVDAFFLGIAGLVSLFAKEGKQ